MTAQRPGSRISQADHPGTYSLIYEKGFDYMIVRPHGSKFAGDMVLSGSLTKAIHEGVYELGTTTDTMTDPVIINYLPKKFLMNFSLRPGEVMTDKAGCVRPGPVSWDVLLIILHSSVFFRRQAYTLQPRAKAQGRSFAFLRQRLWC